MATPPFWTHWYAKIEEENLRQGDLFRNLPAYWLPADLPLIEDGSPEEILNRAEAKGSRADWIILSASCDLDTKRCPQVLLAQVYPVTPETFRAQGNDFLKRQEVVRQGLDPAKFLLAECEDILPPLPRSVVHFRSQVLLPIEYLLRACKAPRLRLRHPFREQLGNWVGSCFSRVGPENPSVIPHATKIHAADIIKAVEDS